MADKRTVFSIPANTWVNVVVGVKNAKLEREKTTVSYYSMSFNAGPPGDTPAGDPTANATSEKMFMNSNTEILEDSANTWIWVRCAKDQVGSLIVTL